MQQHPENEWIEWTGGECPVDPKVRVVVRFGGSEKVGQPESRPGEAARFAWSWTLGGRMGDIIAYRVVSA